MKRSLAPTAALLLATLTACGTTADDAKANHDSVTPRAAATSSSPPTAAASRPAKSCTPTRDVIIWSKVPGISDSAQIVGNYTLATCKTTFEDLPDTSPTEAGYCTLAAWASDNPGYNADARPAKRPKKVQVAVGPAC
ncbi:hypothetical protein ACFUEN_28945 [Streptomyces griseorubiginosus]|uniref:hypothetical protein n=1 Tax=Streptomyces griseorubiginosus TaxID=67304 RepID=UPI003625362E